jgi:hypothetical protein
MGGFMCRAERPGKWAPLRSPDEGVLHGSMHASMYVVAASAPVGAYTGGRPRF